MKIYFNHNGKLFEVSSPALSISNHSYRYGDGLFETMKLVNGVIPLASYHFERLFEGMQLLDFRIPVFFTAEKMLNEIILLAKKNNCSDLGSVRLSVSRGNGGINDCDDKLQYSIECMAAEENVNRLNENGYIIDIFPDAVKSCDKFSNLKPASYLHYIMTAKFARENNLNDALILNQYGRICESSIANIFWVKAGTVFTPPLTEGCVAGVMRRYLLEKLPHSGYCIFEKPCTTNELENADEVFLTNAIKEIRWVQKFRSSVYADSVVEKIYGKISGLLKK